MSALSGRGRLLRVCAVSAFCSFIAAPAVAQETVQVSMPPAISFQVVDVTANSVGSPTPTRVSFSDAVLLLGRALRVSVMADANLSGPEGTSITASNISWTTANPVNGVGINGTLSTASYTPVFESQIGALSGHVDLNWSLASPGTPLHAGNYQTTVRWKVEAFTP